jgi:anti-sigma-K factor RskA
MNCQERREQFLLDAIGALEHAESSELSAHLATGCPMCAGASAEAAAIAAQLALMPRPVQPDPSVLDRLMQRVVAEAGAGAESGLGGERLNGFAQPARRANVQRRPPLILRALPSAMAASVAALLSAAIVWTSLHSQNARSGLELRCISLESAAVANSGPHGSIVWNPNQNTWHVFVFDLKRPGAGKAYELWFIGSDGRKTPGGLFNTGVGGDGNLIASTPPDVGPLAAAAITDEPAAGSPQPTGTIQLLAKLNSAQ